MNIQDTANTRSAYAIGEPVKRKEDSQLLRGQGRFTDDVNLPNQAYAYILRSTIAHGRIKSIGIEAAKAMPGVLAIYTGADMTLATIPQGRFCSRPASRARSWRARSSTRRSFRRASSRIRPSCPC